MAPESSIADLVQRLRAGDAAAADQLFARYARQLTHVAEQHLSRKIAGRVDGEDVVQSVFRTFFRRCADGAFRIDSGAQLWRLLVKITLRKAWLKGRFHTAEARDAGAEVSGDDWLPDALAHEPGPEEATVLVDQIEALLDGLPPLYCQLLELRLEGHTVVEAAARLGVSRHTVHRMLNVLQDRFSASAADAG